MAPKRTTWAIALVCGLLAIVGTLTLVAESLGETVLDEYGYNYTVRVFQGLYENADRDLTNNTGDTTKLVMQWDALFNPTQPESSGTGAWVTNQQSGRYVGVDLKSYRWRYFAKVEYTGPGSPLWGYYTMTEERYLDSGNSVPPRNKPPVLPASTF